ncbi:MAG: hypothetical protein RL418_49 [Actinomycetota bacterium]|jgi:phosphate transport system substrate-binding protein
MKRMFSAIAIGMVSLAMLTACDPPMPESLRVELAEREIVCGQGAVELAGDYLFADLVSYWNDSAALSCDDMQFSFVDSLSSDVGLIVGTGAVDACTPIASVPLAIDAAVITFVLGDFYELTLSPETIGGIFSGSITSWSDPAIIALNPGFELPDQEIILSPSAPAGAADAMQQYLATFGVEVDLSSLEVSDSEYSETDRLFELADGELRLSTFSASSDSGLPFTIIQEDESDPLTRIALDKLSVYSAATQLVSTVDDANGTISVVRDPAKSPLPLAGSSDVAPPYGPVIPIMMSVCGNENEATFARFLVRLDSQGQFASGLHVALPDAIRVAAASILDQKAGLGGE